MNKNTVMRDISNLILIVFLAVAVYFAFQKVDKYFRIKAIDDCGKISRYEVSGTDGSQVWYPIADVYKACLKDKGY